MWYILVCKIQRLFLALFLPASQLGVCAGVCRRAQVDESGTIMTQTGMHDVSENNLSAWDALYDTTP
jgi:hypothetical protein